MEKLFTVLIVSFSLILLGLSVQCAKTTTTELLEPLAKNELTGKTIAFQLVGTKYVKHAHKILTGMVVSEMHLPEKIDGDSLIFSFYTFAKKIKLGDYVIETILFSHSPNAHEPRGWYALVNEKPKYEQAPNIVPITVWMNKIN